MSQYVPPFFIVGAQRSGSTLLRLILNAHSHIAVPEEARFLTPLLRRENLHTRLSRDQLSQILAYLASNHQFRLWNYDASSFFEWLASVEEVKLCQLIDALYSGYSWSQGKRTWGDKSLFSREIDLLASMFPAARFIHIVRDGRDVFDSWRRIDPSKNHSTVIALDWTRKLHLIERTFASLPPRQHLTIRYEDLVTDPVNVVSSVCAFLEVEYESRMLEFYRTSHYYVGRHHSELIFQPIDGTNAGKWRQRLSRREARTFTYVARSELARFGYPVGDLKPGLVDALWGVTDLATWLPVRVGQVYGTRFSMRRALRCGRATAASGRGLMPARTAPPAYASRLRA